MSLSKEAVDGLKWASIRTRRNQLISDSDVTQLADYPISDEEKTRWAEYRQALRDIPNVYDNPDDVVWPEKPAS